MVRETRHLWVGNLPENIREDRIRDHFKRYGRVQSVKLLGRGGGGGSSGSGTDKEEVCATVSFMDIKSAAKAHHSEQKLEDRLLTTEYHEPPAIPLHPAATSSSSSASAVYQRFHLGGEELSSSGSSFDRSSHYFDRPTSGGTGGGGGGEVGGYLGGGGGRRGYHSAESLSRSRARDRGSIYRNGPYNSIIESVVSRSSTSGSHHTGSSGGGAGGVPGVGVGSRGGSSTPGGGTGTSGWTPYDTPSPRYPPPGSLSLPLPDLSSSSYPEPVSSLVIHKKHSKSRHVSCRSGSESGGSGSSRSRSSSASSGSGSSTCSTASSSPALSEKSCSTHHSHQSSLRSGGGGGGQSNSTGNHTSGTSPAVHSDDRRPLAICVRNLPARSSDTSLKDGLYHEYKKHGKVTWVKVVGQGVDRYALVSFKKAEDVDKALQVSHDKLFFGCKIEVAPYHGYDVDDNEFRPFEAEQDEFHPKATRTLFIGNLDKDITTQEIRKHFEQFGDIIDIDIKKQSGTSTSYAFCQFPEISSVVRAMRSLDGEHVGGSRVKLGFGKSMHTSCVWVDGLAESVSEKYLNQQFSQFGPVSHVVVDRVRGQALVSYEQITYAQQAVKEMRGVVLRGRKLQVDYASRECQEYFYDHMEKPTSAHVPFDNSGSSPGALQVLESPSSTSTTPTPSSGPSVVAPLPGGGAPLPLVAGTPPASSGACRYSSSCTVGGAVTGRYTPAARFPPRVSPTTSARLSSRHPTRYSEYPPPSSAHDYDRRSSYRSYEDVTVLEENGPVGESRHLGKERLSLSEQLEECTSSGEEGLSRSGGRRCTKHRRSGSGGESSRPGTPLCDERPENLGPVEPRRPRDSRPTEVISLPLPRFASQVLSPRPAPPSPPASPLTHSSSSDSEPSPEWEERLRSLDEKYEKWSGSRAGLSKPDPSSIRIRHKLLELDLHEIQPSEIVKSVLAKRSVFDEDSKRLENFGEKYEPREFVPARSSLLRGRLDLSPMSSPVVKSPSSPAAKGLQYPFPSHPPVQPTTSVATTIAPTTPTLTVASPEVKSSTFLTNCTPTRQFSLVKISSPQAEKIETSPRTPTSLKDPRMQLGGPKPVPVTKPPTPEVKKELPLTPAHTKVKSSHPLRRESCDEKKVEEVRRKSRDESVESVRSVESVKREDTTECDKVKDGLVVERRKSLTEKRRNSEDIKDIPCERTKDFNDKRRGSMEVESEPCKKPEKKLFEENHLDLPKPAPEIEKAKKSPNDSFERRRDSEPNIRHSVDVDKKKDVLGVNSEKDRRRNRESSDSFDNPKPKKVPELKKESEPAEKREKEEDNKIAEIDRRRESSDSANGKHKEKKDHLDRRRESLEHSIEKKVDRVSPDNSELNKTKEKKVNHDLIESRNSKKHHEEADLKNDNNKLKDSDKRKHVENEVSKEHSLFKKVFGFAERTYGHHKDRRDSDSTAVKTDDNIKHKKDHSEKEKKKDRGDAEHTESSSKHHKSRKSPDQPENNRHKERKHSESEKRSRKDYDLADDHKQKDDHSESFHSKSHRREERNKELSVKNSYLMDQELSPSLGKQERRRDTFVEESSFSETDSNDLKIKDGDTKRDNEVLYERRKEEAIDNRNKEERRRDSEKFFETEKAHSDGPKIKDENDFLKDFDKKNEPKHDKCNEKRKESAPDNCRVNDLKDNLHQDNSKPKDDRRNDEIFDSLKSPKEDNRYRDFTRRKDGETQDHIRIKDIIESKKKEEKEKRKEREAQELKKLRDFEEKNRDPEKMKRKKEFEISEPKVNGDHDDYLDNMDSKKPSYEEDIRIDPIKKEKKKERSNTWPATIGCKRRLSSQESLDIVEDAKRSKPERRDSKDSGRSSGSSRKGSSEKHNNKGYSKLLEEKIKEDKEHEQRRKEELVESNEKLDEKLLKPAFRKEKRNSGEKRKEERKLKNRSRENGTASESDIASGDDEATKSIKRQQHSIFDIVDDEPAYISMYDKVKARSTKNMQKQEEEKRQEKLKEKFHQLKASRAKREEKKRSTSYDEDSDSEKGSSRRSNKLLITSSEEDACSESDVRIRSRKILCDTSEDDTLTSPQTHHSKMAEYESKSLRKVVSDISEDEPVIKHSSTPKVKSSRNISFDSDLKSRKIMSDTSEDDSSRHIIPQTPRQKHSRIHSDESEGDLGFEEIRAESGGLVKPAFIEPPVKITDVFTSRPVEMNHFTSNTENEEKLNQNQSSPESLRRISLDSTASELPRKKSHKKKQKKKNYEVSEDGSIIIRKHSSKKEKKRSHRDNDDEDKKSRKKKSEREGSSSKREEKYEDIFGPLSDDSEKAAIGKWQVSQVYGSDSESERENIRKKEKKRREKKQRELDEAGQALEAKLLDNSEMMDMMGESYELKPGKTKKKKRKKSRDEKMKHHRSVDDESGPPVLSRDHESVEPPKTGEKEEVKDSEQDVKHVSENEREEDDDNKIVSDYSDHFQKEFQSVVVRQHSSSLSSLLDSPPPHSLPSKKPDIPGFGVELDENIHETAVKSISQSIIQMKYDDKSKQDDQSSAEDKPTPVISQEETEDAVAALLMEDNFGSIGFERYTEETPKPDTPISEPDLQIDTDTEDNFDPDFTKPHRESDEDQSAFFQQNDTREGLEERIMPLACTETSIAKETEKPLEDVEIKEESESLKSECPDSSEGKFELPNANVSIFDDVKDSEIRTVKTEFPDAVDPKTEPLSHDSNISLNDELKSSEVKPENKSFPSMPSIEANHIPEVTPSDRKSAIEHTPSREYKSVLKPTITELEPLSEIKTSPSPTISKPDSLPLLDIKSETTVPNIIKSDTTPKVDCTKSSVVSEIHQAPMSPAVKSEIIQEDNKANISERSVESMSPIASPSPSSLCQKSEKVHHPGPPPVSHPSVLVHQTLKQSQTPQIMKPVTIQVINHPPALKPLDQPAAKISPASPLGMKLASPPTVLTSTSQVMPPFQSKSQQPPPSQMPQTKPPLHHMSTLQGMKLSTSVPHLVSPHLPVKPATQIALQTPQLTPIIRSTISPQTTKPLVVHTIQNHSSQKQLHVVTSSPQLSPQQPLSPQNLKIIRPLQNPASIIKPPHSPQPVPVLTRPPHTQSIPLLQTVNSCEKQFNIRAPIVKTNQSHHYNEFTNSHIHLSPKQLPIPQPEKVVNVASSNQIQIPLPEKGVNISPGSPAATHKSLMTMKTSESRINILENNIDGLHSPKGCEELVMNCEENCSPKSQLKSDPLRTFDELKSDHQPLPSKAPSDEVGGLRSPVFEPIPVKPPSEEPKPLNAVVQDLTVRATSKTLPQKLDDSSALPDIKSEAPKQPPEQQEVKESQQQKAEPENPPSSQTERPPEKPESPEAIVEAPPKVEVEAPLESSRKDSPEANDEVSKEHPIAELNPEIEKPVTDSPKDSKDDSKQDVLASPPPISDNTDSEVPLEPLLPQPSTPKSPKESETEILLPETKVADEKMTVAAAIPNSSGRGRGGRGGGRGKRGRGGGWARGGGRGGGGRGGSSSLAAPPAAGRPPPPSATSEPPPSAADVYEFRDDSEEERPRLILTIKSDQPSQHQPPVSHNAPSTRKSRRLQEKDGSKNSHEESDEGTSRGSTRSGRRATRSSAPLLSVPTTVDTPRKSPRRKQARERTSHEDRSPTPVLTPSPGPLSGAPASPAQPPPSPQKEQLRSPPPQQQTPQEKEIIEPPAKQPQPRDQLKEPVLPKDPKEPAQVAQTVQPVQPQPPVPQPPAKPPAAPLPVAAPTKPQALPPAAPIKPQAQPVVAPIKPQAQPVVAPIKPQAQPVVVPIKPQAQPAAAPPKPQALPQPAAAAPKPLPSPPAVTVPAPLKPIQATQTIKLPPKLFAGKAIELHNKLTQAQPTQLVDPVTGLLIPMREGEEGQYVPMAGDSGEPPPEKRPRLDETVVKAPIATVRPSVVRPPQQSSIAKPTSPPNLPQKPVISNPVPRPPKAHLLQAVAAEQQQQQRARATVASHIQHQQPPSPLVAPPPGPPPRPKLAPPLVVQPIQQQQPIQAPKPPPLPHIPKAHVLQSIGNAPSREGIIGSPAPHHGPLLAGSVASPPLRAAHSQPIATTARFVGKGVVEQPSGRMAPEGGGCIVVATPSPRGQVMQAGLPIPAYEASLHGVVAELLPNPQWPRQPSPPPAHQHSTQTQGEVVQHVNYPSGGGGGGGGGGQPQIQPAHCVHPQQLMYQQYLREAALGPPSHVYHRPPPGGLKESEESEGRGGSRVVSQGSSPPLELSRRRPSPHDRTTDSPQVATLYGRALYPPLAHRPAPPASSSRHHQIATPPHASQVPPQADSLLELLQRYPVMWQGLLALKNDQAAVQMHFVFGNPIVARDSLPFNSDGSTPPLRIAQRMRLEQTQLDGVARKMQMQNEHCMLLALPCGRDHMDVLQQSNNLKCGFITYLQQKQAAGIINVAAPGLQQAAYVVHIFPSSEFANNSLARIAPDLFHRVTGIAHLLIVIATTLPHSPA